MKFLSIGDVRESKNFGKYEIINIEGDLFEIKFYNTGFKKSLTIEAVRTNSVRDPTYPNVYGVGFIGDGKYASRKNKRLYQLWHNMFMRCYCSRYQTKYPSYIGCSVVKRWHNFQNFCSDIIKMANWDKLDWQLDKDLRVFGNKKYGPKYCSFVPSAINNLILHFEESNGFKHTKNNTYEAKIKINNKTVALGTYKSKQKAINAYLTAKRTYIKEVADLYKSDIHINVYKNLKTLLSA